MSNVYGDSDATDLPSGSSPYHSAMKRRKSLALESDQSGFGWGDAQSNISDCLDESLELLAAEISSRTYPTETTARMEDSPETIRSVSDTNMVDYSGRAGGISRTDSQALAERMGAIQTKAVEQFGLVDEQLLDGQTQQNHIATIQKKVEEQFGLIADQLSDGQIQRNQIVTTADALVTSFQTALTASNISQQKHETEIRNNVLHLNTLLQNNQVLVAKNRDLEQMSRTQLQATAIQEGRQRNLSAQSATMQQNQWTQQQQMGSHEQATLQAQQEFAQMREIDRNRTEFPSPKPSSGPATNRTTQPVGEPIPTRPDGTDGEVFDPGKTTNGGNSQRESGAK